SRSDWPRPKVTSTGSVGSLRQIAPEGITDFEAWAFSRTDSRGWRCASCFGAARNPRSAQWITQRWPARSTPVTHMTKITTPAMLPAVRWHQKRILRRLMWVIEAGASGFGPAAEEVVIDAGEADAG